MNYLPPPPIEEEEAWFRHTHWAARREHHRPHGKVQLRKIQRRKILQLRVGAVVEYDAETGKNRIRANYCHNRLCEPCMRAKANLMAANLTARLECPPEGNYRFVTLTLKHSDAPLREQIDRLYASWKKLRADKLWKDSQKGGAAVLEVKLSDQDQKWHPHLHIVTEGGYIDQRDLSTAWYSITGDSFKVDIRALRSAKDACHYLSKYITKGVTANVWDRDDTALEWMCSMRGVRTAATFGSWRGYKLLAKPKDDREWVSLGLLTKIVQQARSGDRQAIGLLDALSLSKQYNPNRKRTTPA